MLLSVDDRSHEVIKAAEKFELVGIVDPDERQIATAFARLAAEAVNRIRVDTPALLKAMEKLHVAREAALLAFRETKIKV